MPETETGKAVPVLDLLLEHFGEHGEHWTRDSYDDGQGRTVWSALYSICATSAVLPARARSVFCTRQ
jgi:hypothetical protein